ncbi:MAG: RICIN domain-containing protein [Sinobacteraceae bacterium]|nr:RICIN domain-containing protein [Nevskiaceae bacterium]
MYRNVLGEKVSRKRYREMLAAARNRRELIAAGLGRRELLKMGLLSGAGMLLPIKGLSGRNLDTSGKDKGPVWLVCPSIPDTTRGGIAADAFVDTVRRRDGSPVDPDISRSFSCLQKTGQFCNLPSGTYRVKNQDSGLFWDGSSSAAGRPIQLATLNTSSGNTSQEWTFVARGDGTYKVTNKASGLSLDVPNASQAPGAVLSQDRGDADADEQWLVTPVNNGFLITNAGNKLAVDATIDTPDPGTSIVQATPNGETRQIWVIH